jgi:hypothetical protein
LSEFYSYLSERNLDHLGYGNEGKYIAF